MHFVLSLLRPASPSSSLAELSPTMVWTVCKRANCFVVGETKPENRRRESLGEGRRCFTQTAWSDSVPTSVKVGDKVQDRQAAALLQAHAPSKGRGKATSSVVLNWSDGLSRRTRGWTKPKLKQQPFLHKQHGSCTKVHHCMDGPLKAAP